MWDPQAAVELDSIVSKIGRKYSRKKSQAEFHVSSLQNKFLYSALAHHRAVSQSQYHAMRDRIKKIVDEYSALPHDVMCSRVQDYLLDDAFIVFAAFREYVHVREHAKIALIPLLQHLSVSDSKKLVYAVFVERWTGSEDGGTVRSDCFSREHFGSYSFAHDDIPCGSPIIHANLFLDALRWIKEPTTCRKNFKHDTLLRLFGLALPTNIVTAMADFLVDRLYHPYDVSLQMDEYSRSLGVSPTRCA
jgi:hypothetical protein